MFPTLWVVNFYNHLVSYSIPSHKDVTMLVSSTWALPSRNFDVPCDFNTFASTSWTQNLTYSKERHEKERLRGWKKKLISLRAGFEPAREDPIGFQVQRLNHSAITADCKFEGKCLYLNMILLLAPWIHLLILRIKKWLRNAGLKPGL